MPVKRTSLKTRRAQDKRGVDAMFEPTNKAPDAAEGKESLAKVTLYIRPDQVVAIEDIQLAQRKETGKRPDKSALVQEALDLLISKYSKTAGGFYSKTLKREARLFHSHKGR